MFVFGKDLETKRFKAVAGMPVPPKYSSSPHIKSLRLKYGHDAIKEIPQAYIKPEQMLEIFSASANEQIKKLAELCASQEKIIDEQNKELEKLRSKKRVSEQELTK